MKCEREKEEKKFKYNTHLPKKGEVIRHGC